MKTNRRYLWMFIFLLAAPLQSHAQETQFWLAYQVYPFLCDPQNPPKGVQEYCKTLPRFWDHPGGLKDFDEMIASSKQWEETYEKMSVFSVPEHYLRYLLDYGDEEVLNGLERILREKTLGVGTNFLQAEDQSMVRFDRDAGQCCVYLDDPKFEGMNKFQPANDVFKKLKGFIQNRAIESPNIAFFVDVMDVITPDQLVKIVKDHDAYAQELLKHAKMIREYFPGAIIYFHEINGWWTGDQYSRDFATQNIEAMARQTKEAKITNIGFMIDMYSADPRGDEPSYPSERCRRMDSDQGDRALEMLEALLKKGQEQGLLMSFFNHHFMAPFVPDPKDPCWFPRDDSQVNLSYIATAKKIRENNLQPDAVVFTSWFPRPNKGLPESDPQAVTYGVKRAMEIYQAK